VTASPITAARRWQGRPAVSRSAAAAGPINTAVLRIAPIVTQDSDTATHREQVEEADGADGTPRAEAMSDSRRSTRRAVEQSDDAEGQGAQQHEDGIIEVPMTNMERTGS